MTEIHIDKATNAQLDYAVAVAQGWFLTGKSKDYWHNGNHVVYGLNDSCIGASYKPTTNQAQCFDLIAKFKILCEWNAESGDSIPDYTDEWYCNIYGSGFFYTDESLSIAAVKALLLAKFPDGKIPVFNDNIK